MFMLTTASALQVALGVVFVLVSALMILVVLIQKPKGGGLAGAFGGAGGGQQAMFGAKVGDFLTWVTVGFFAAFLLIACFIVWTAQGDAAPPGLPAVSPPPAEAPDQPADTSTGTPGAVDQTGDLPPTDGAGSTTPEPPAED